MCSLEGANGQRYIWHQTWNSKVREERGPFSAHDGRQTFVLSLIQHWHSSTSQAFMFLWRHRHAFLIHAPAATALFTSRGPTLHTHKNILYGIPNLPILFCHTSYVSIYLSTYLSIHPFLLPPSIQLSCRCPHAGVLCVVFYIPARNPTLGFYRPVFFVKPRFLVTMIQSFFLF